MLGEAMSAIKHRNVRESLGVCCSFPFNPTYEISLRSYTILLK
jgi:hypothetical protein